MSLSSETGALKASRVYMGSFSATLEFAQVSARARACLKMSRATRVFRAIDNHFVYSCASSNTCYILEHIPVHMVSSHQSDGPVLIRVPSIYGAA